MRYIVDIETICKKIKQFADNDIDIIHRSYFEKEYVLLRKHKRYNAIGQEFVIETMMTVEMILLYTEQTIEYVNQMAKIFLNSEYGWLYNDTDSVTTEEAQYVIQDNIIIQDFFKKQEV